MGSGGYFSVYSRTNRKGTDMAHMIPSDVRQFHTRGEEEFYLFLKSYAKPDSRYIVWYLPDINDHEPDFILYSQNTGLVVFEVKDWELDQIQEADVARFTLVKGSRVESNRNPYQQARSYQEALMGKITGDERLVSKVPEHAGRPKIPISRGVVFPNIFKYDFEETGLGKVIPPEKVFFKDDLSIYSPICGDPSGREFTRAVERMYPPMFIFSLTPGELNHLRQLIFPTVRIDLPWRGPSSDYRGHVDTVAMLDHQQEVLARKFDGGRRVISGPPGSGKTLVLVNKALYLRKYNPSMKRILFVCYNITLVHYIRRLLAGKQVPMGTEGVEVCHFFELCAKITGETVHHEKEGSDYYETVLQLALEKLPEISLKYDAILVDEGQDLNDDMCRLIEGILNPATNSLTIAIDPTQVIYDGKGAGIEKKGKIYRLDRVYRSTREISDFASAFVGRKVDGRGNEEKEGGLFPSLFESHGPRPLMDELAGPTEVIAYVADSVSSLVHREGFSCSEIALLYVSKTVKSPERDISLPEELMTALNGRGILSAWASEDYRSKRSYDITTNSVTISTIHSAKGLDYACVVLLGLDFMDDDKLTEEHLRNLVHVGITRARYRLFIPFVTRTLLIERLLKCL